jgi:hypothetical protein
VTAHPLALIAGMSDHIDVEQREHVDAHIASCDTCRTFARAIERADRLIASPEPSLALPARVSAERHRSNATTALATVAASLILVVVVVALRQSSQQTAARPAWADMVAQGNDACDLAPAGRVVRVAEPPRAAFPMVPPLSPSAPFQGECAYGYHEGLFEFHLLTRTEPTALGEARVWWRAFAGGQGSALLSGPSDDAPGPGGVATIRWTATAHTAGRQWSVMGVAAEPYFFVVTAQTSEGARQFADVVLGALLNRPMAADAWRESACMLIDRAAIEGGLPAGPSNPPADLHPHWGYTSTVFESNMCAYRVDSWWDDPHLFLRAGTTMPSEVGQLLADSFSFLNAPPEFAMEHLDAWAPAGEGMWLAHARSPNERRWTAVAVFSDSRFFMVTSDTDDKAIRLARAVAAELKR